MTIPDPDNNSLIAGEQWRIEGTLLDKEGNRLNLTGASIIWTLLDESGAPITTNAVVAVLDPPTAGIITIELTPPATSGLAPGLYTEELQITIAGRTSVVRGLSIIVVAKGPQS